VNCAAIPEHLIEAELFGYVAGAFTGASKQGAQGRLREAHGGTLFLDEIGDMPLSLQTRLLRVLQERQVTPLGSNTPVNVDFNLICATHQNLKNSIVAGRFREDLYYRINGLTVCLPALRMRTDFAFLCGRLLQEFAPDSALHIAPDLLAAMKTYHWPGNLRQLSHVLRAAVALREDDQHCISWEHLADDLAAELRSQTGTETITTSAGGDTVEPRERSLHARSMQAIRQALTNANGNVSAAARELGISRQTLYRKLQEN
jgi:transcriptional regulator with PAS, ATPase and Fis domain